MIPAAISRCSHCKSPESWWRTEINEKLKADGTRLSDATPPVATSIKCGYHRYREYSDAACRAGAVHWVPRPRTGNARARNDVARTKTAGRGDRTTASAGPAHPGRYHTAELDVQ